MSEVLAFGLALFAFVWLSADILRKWWDRRQMQRRLDDLWED